MLVGLELPLLLEPVLRVEWVAAAAAAAAAAAVATWTLISLLRLRPAWQMLSRLGLALRSARRSLQLPLPATSQMLKSCDGGGWRALANADAGCGRPNAESAQLP